MTDRSVLGDSPADPAAAAAAYVRSEHGAFLEEIDAAAAAVADERAAPPQDGRALADALETALADRGLTGRLPGVLSGAVEAADLTLAAEPVAAPPYVAVTSRGPVLRATTDAGRLVVTLVAFTVEDGPDRQYCRSSPTTVEAEFDG
jgi:hypothetical protein